MGNLALTMACGPYDRFEALHNGVVRPEGIDLTYLAIQSPPEIFVRMVKNGSFDISEMSASMYLTRKAQGDFPFIALPIFPLRMFRHGFVFVNTQSGIKTPKDLEGKRIGVQEHRQTAGIWIRGILRSEYGVSFENVKWFEGGVNTPRHPDPAMDLRPQTQLQIERVDLNLNLRLQFTKGGNNPYIISSKLYQGNCSQKQYNRNQTFELHFFSPQ